MKTRITKSHVQRLQVGIFCLVVCANLALLTGLLAAFAHIIENEEATRLFAASSLLATLTSIWLGYRASCSPIFLNYERSMQVYYPGIALSIVMAVVTHYFVTYSWDVQRPFWIIILTAALFMIVCMGIKLSNSRHALD